MSPYYGENYLCYCINYPLLHNKSLQYLETTIIYYFSFQGSEIQAVWLQFQVSHEIIAKAPSSEGLSEAGVSTSKVAQ
jgi:hypothetical protein